MVYFFPSCVLDRALSHQSLFEKGAADEEEREEERQLDGEHNPPKDALAQGAPRQGGVPEN